MTVYWIEVLLLRSQWRSFGGKFLFFLIDSSLSFDKFRTRFSVVSNPRIRIVFLKMSILLSKFESVKIYWLSVKFDWIK